MSAANAPASVPANVSADTLADTPANKPVETPETQIKAAPLRALYDVTAPAKLNLFLHITGRRADGYHLLQSVFMLIDWCDTLHFELREDGVISREDLTSGSDVAFANEALPADDLSVRAARALQQATGTRLGTHIGLLKRIPAQAGMGGGSSDAAACLLALQRLWGVHLPAQQLHALALSLGADVPFFLSGGHAWVQGIGDVIAPLELPQADFLRKASLKVGYISLINNFFSIEKSRNSCR